MKLSALLYTEPATHPLPYNNKGIICAVKGREKLYLDKMENRARRKGRMRMAMDRQDEMSGFVGGLA